MDSRFANAVTNTKPALQPENRLSVPSAACHPLVRHWSRPQSAKASCAACHARPRQAFSQARNRDFEPLQVVGVQMEKLVFGITNVEDCPASHKTRAEFFDDCFDERVLSAGRNGYGFAGRKFHRDAASFRPRSNSLRMRWQVTRYVFNFALHSSVSMLGSVPARELQADRRSCRCWWVVPGRRDYGAAIQPLQSISRPRRGWFRVFGA